MCTLRQAYSWKQKHLPNAIITLLINVRVATESLFWESVTTGTVSFKPNSLPVLEKHVFLDLLKSYITVHRKCYARRAALLGLSYWYYTVQTKAFVIHIILIDSS